VTARITTLAFRVHRMEAMLAFYAEAFGVSFREVKTGPFTSRFGELGGTTLKFVPIREAADFEKFAVHQPGIEVAGDLHRVIAAALKHGGRVENPPVEDGDQIHAAIRDPDGNTIELYATKSAPDSVSVDA
jgi:catechol 2,3-dioxygenase-like lactoylglutathione lyase family enzyme